MWYTVKIRFYTNDRPVVTFYEKSYRFKRNALKYIDSIKSVRVHAYCSLDELAHRGFRARAELYNRKNDCIYDTRLPVELDEDSRVEVMQV